MVEVEGKVDVSGSTVKVDSTSLVQKSLENARRAKDKEDWEECEKYYNMVEQYEPNNIEAIFYSSYGKAKMAMVESDLFKLIGGSYVVNARKNVSTGITISDDSAYTVLMFDKLVLAWIESLHNIEKKISEPQKLVYIWKILRQNYLYIHSMTNSRENAEKSALKIEKIDRDINSVDSSYHGKQLPKSNYEQAEENKKKLRLTILCTIGALAVIGAIIYAVYLSTSL